MLQSQQEVKIVRIIRKHDQTLAPLCSLLDLTGFCLTLIMLIKLSLGKNSLKLIKFYSKYRYTWYTLGMQVSHFHFYVFSQSRIYMSNGGSGVKILETHVEPRTTAKLT